MPKYNIYDAFMGQVTNTVDAAHAGAALDAFAEIGEFANWQAAVDAMGPERAADIYVLPHSSSGFTADVRVVER